MDCELVARAHQTAVWERTRPVLRLRSTLLQYFGSGQLQNRRCVATRAACASAGSGSSGSGVDAGSGFALEDVEEEL